MPMPVWTVCPFATDEGWSFGDLLLAVLPIAKGGSTMAQFLVFFDIISSFAHKFLSGCLEQFLNHW